MKMKNNEDDDGEGEDDDAHEEDETDAKLINRPLTTNVSPYAPPYISLYFNLTWMVQFKLPNMMSLIQIDKRKKTNRIISI